jgi:hypothetical protein
MNVVCFDSADAIGVTAFSGISPVSSVHHHILKRLSEFEISMPADFPIFPHCEVRAYLEAYAAHFGLAPFID